MPDGEPIRYADLHIHPAGEVRDAVAVEAIYEAVLASSLAVAVFAEHDRVDIAQELVARVRTDDVMVELLVGEEITTRGGHRVGVGLTSRVPRGMPLGETVAAVHAQGAIAVVAHPLLPIWTSASEATLTELAEGDPAMRPDAVEGMHPVAAWWPGWRRRVEELAQRLEYAVVGGSDAHRARAVGRGRTGFRGATGADLFSAIRARETWTEGSRSPLRDIFRGDRQRDA